MGFWSSIKKAGKTFFGGIGNTFGGLASGDWDRIKSGINGLTFGTTTPLLTWGDTLSGETANKQYQEQFQYAQEQDQLTREREDTAYQRAAADMQTAGLNPLSGVNPAQSSNGTGGVSPTQSGSTAGLGDILGAITNIYGTIASRAIAKDQLTQQAQIAQSNADAQKEHNQAMEQILAQNAGTNATQAESNVKTQTKQQSVYEKQIEELTAQIEKLEAETAELKRGTKYREENDIDTTTPKETGLLNTLLNKGKKMLDQWTDNPDVKYWEMAKESAPTYWSMATGQPKEKFWKQNTKTIEKWNEYAYKQIRKEN